MNCKSCQQDIDDNDKYCPYCGIRTVNPCGMEPIKKKTRGSKIIYSVVVAAKVVQLD